MRKTLISLAVASAVTTSLFADAQTDDLKAQLKALTERLNTIEKKSGETEEKTDSLLVELANSKISDSFGQYTGESYAGMSPGISKVYTNKNKLSVGGYGKVDYTNNRDQKTTTVNKGAADEYTKTKDTTDAYRAVLYFGYRFTDNIILNTEIEFEHGGSAEHGETEVEMLALDFLVNDYANFRVGTYVVPIGRVALNHEPTLFNTVKRPTTEVNIIPSTWFENGAMVYGSVMDSTLSYQTGIISGFDATESTTLRSMRSKGSKSPSQDAGYFLRLDYEPNDNFAVAGSYYYGGAGQGASDNGSAVSLSEVDVSLWEVHATAKMAGFELNALYATHEIGGAADLAQWHGIDGKPKEATKEAFGYYANLNYTYGDWVPFAQYEVSNKFDKGVDELGTKFSYEDTTETTLGLNWKPHPQVVLKANYVIAETGKKDSKVDDDRFELGMGFVF